MYNEKYVYGGLLLLNVFQLIVPIATQADGNFLSYSVVVTYYSREC